MLARLTRVVIGAPASSTGKTTVAAAIAYGRRPPSFGLPKERPLIG